MVVLGLLLMDKSPINKKSLEKVQRQHEYTYLYFWLVPRSTRFLIGCILFHVTLARDVTREWLAFPAPCFFCSLILKKFHIYHCRPRSFWEPFIRTNSLLTHLRPKDNLI